MVSVAQRLHGGTTIKMLSNKGELFVRYDLFCLGTSELADLHDAAS